MAKNRIVYRTSAFSVTDEEAWRGLYNRLSDKDNVKDLEAYGFHTLESSTSGICVSFDEEMDIAKDFPEWTKDLQKILSRQSVFMLVASYYDDDEHTGDSVTMITTSNVTFNDMADEIYLQAVGLKSFAISRQDTEANQFKPTAEDIREELQNTLPEWETYIWRHTTEECEDHLLQMFISKTTADLLAGFMHRARRYR